MGVKFMGFLDKDTLHEFRRFVNLTLSYKYGLYIDVEETVVVTGLCGSDVVRDALTVRFFPSHAKTWWVEDRIAEDIHRYCYENGLSLVKDIVIERCVCDGDVRYGLVYTDGRDYSLK